MSSICRELKTEYEQLKALNQEFVSACDKAGDPRLLSAQELRTLQIMKQRVEKARDALKEKLAIIIRVPNALNPYREALLASGIPNIENSPLSQERRDITLNLRETLKQQQEYYKSMGLTAWAENIATLQLSHLTPEKRKEIEQEIKDGAIPIVMPDKETQLNTTVDQLQTAFKPTWIKDGEEQQVNDAYLEWDHFINFITTKHKDLVEGVPDHPYISMMRPTQAPDARTTNKTMDEQLQEFTAINTKRVEEHQLPANIINPHEYGALQTIHSRFVKEMLPPDSKTLDPIDSNTYTRFINLPVSSTPHCFVPSAFFFPVNAQARFSGLLADDRYAMRGFRLAVRVSL